MPSFCIVCDSRPPFVRVFRPAGSDWCLVRCTSCGLVFQDPQPSSETLADSYYHDPAHAGKLAGELRPLTLKTAREKLALLRAINAFDPAMRVLDVGASAGAWLEVASAEGAIVTGVEIGEAAADLARQRGLEVHTGTLEQCMSVLSGREFDLITFWDVLEHLNDPRKELSLAAELLAPGGVVAATFPNVEGLYPRVTYRLLARRFGVWEYPELPLHLFDFSPSTARRLLQRTGYSVSALTTRPVPFSYYRATSLSVERLGGGMRARALRLVFEALRLLIYPAARLCGRENSLFLAAHRRSQAF